MKYVRVLKDGCSVWGTLEDGRIRALLKPPFEGIEYTGQVFDLSQCKLLAPCQPSKIVCVGKNYYDHAVEMQEGIPEKPIIFIKPSTCLNDPDGDIIYPNVSKRVDYEGELAFVIKKTAKKVNRQDAAAYILGYTCLNDVTARDIQKSEGQWTRGKGFDTFAPIGPWIEDSVDAADLQLETRLNGKTVQQSHTGLFMWKIPEILEFITECMTLLPGDVVATGTPAGIGPMLPGDVVEVIIEGIGILKNNVTKE